MKLENFKLLDREPWLQLEQCVLEFGDYHNLSILRYKDTGIYEIEFEVKGYVKNPFDKNCTGTIYNISEKQINNYILLLTLLTGSHPTQV
jgi:hypothetical protein